MWHDPTAHARDFAERYAEPFDQGWRASAQPLIRSSRRSQPARVKRGFQSPTRGGVRKGYATHSWKSELALVGNDTQRDVLSSVLAPVRPEVDF